MQLSFINVGYGDAFLFQGEDGYTALLDGGSALETEFQSDPYRIPALDYLQAQGIQHLDAVILSHIHEDHVCGLERVLEAIPCDRLFLPYPLQPFREGADLEIRESLPRSVKLYTAALNAYRHILQLQEKRGGKIEILEVGQEKDLACDLRFLVLGPRPGVLERYMEKVQALYQNTGEEERARLLTWLDAASNATSLLLKFWMPGMRFLAAADNCPRGWEERILPELEDVNVLKLPHHGQKDAVSETFMSPMHLDYVITTASSDRRYQSANPQVYERLKALHPHRPQPCFLFTDERDYPPYFSQPEGFRAIRLVGTSGGLRLEFIHTLDGSSSVSYRRT